MEGTDGGLHPAVDGQSRWQDDIARKEGTTWNRKATDRRQWKASKEGYILQWVDKPGWKVIQTLNSFLTITGKSRS